MIDVQEGVYTFLVTAYKEPLNAERATPTASASITVVARDLFQVSVVSSALSLASFPNSMPLQLSCEIIGEISSAHLTCHNMAPFKHPMTVTAYRLTPQVPTQPFCLYFVFKVQRLEG